MQCQRLAYIEHSSINDLTQRQHTWFRAGLSGGNSPLRPMISFAVIEEAVASDAGRLSALWSLIHDLASHGVLVGDRSEVLAASLVAFESGMQEVDYESAPSIPTVKLRLRERTMIDSSDSADAIRGNRAMNREVETSGMGLRSSGLVPTAPDEWLLRGMKDDVALGKFLSQLGQTGPKTAALAGAILEDRPVVRPWRAAYLITLTGFAMRAMEHDIGPIARVSALDMNHAFYLSLSDVMLANLVAPYLGHEPLVMTLEEAKRYEFSFQRN